MENKDQPAYPNPGGAELYAAAGLTKRELIAAMAMQGIVSALAASPKIITDRVEVAKISIMYADELLTQLQKQS